MDELLVQFDRQRAATWPITDAGGDIVGPDGRSLPPGEVGELVMREAFGPTMTAPDLPSRTR